MARHRWKKKTRKPLDFSKYSLKRLNGIIATSEKRISAIEIVLKADNEALERNKAKGKMAFDERSGFNEKVRPYWDKIRNAERRLGELGFLRKLFSPDEAETIKNEIKMTHHEISEIDKNWPKEKQSWTSETTLERREADKLWGKMRPYLERLATAKRCLQKAQQRESEASLKKQVEKSKHQRIKAMADAYAGKARKMADTIRRQLKRYDYCPYCFGSLGNEPHADHIHPVSAGGLSVEENMIFVCSICNGNKSDLTLRAFCTQFGHSRDRIEGILIQLGKRV